MKACYNCQPHNFDKIYKPGAHQRLQEMLEFTTPNARPKEGYEWLLPSAEGIEIMLTTWGALPVTAELLNRCPDLKLIVHGAGSVKAFVTQDVIDRGITVSSAVEINARPVAEYCLGVILCALKDVFRYAHRFNDGYAKENWWDKSGYFIKGWYRSSVGLIGFGKITRVLLELLKPFDIDVYVSSGYFSPEDEEQYGARKADTDWIFENCDLVSIHSADIPRNYNIVNADRLAMMKEGAYLLNTARGRMVDEAALYEALKTRDLYAILDVTHPEPPEENNPLLSLENCIFTPHISGSYGPEVQRMGEFVADEIERFQAGEPLQGLVDISNLASIA